MERMLENKQLGRSARRHLADPAPSPSLRRPVAVIVSRFPKITETFILREIQELERQGQPVRLVPLLRQRDPVVHPDAEPWVARALYTPFISPSILRENVQAFLDSPRRYLGVLARVLVGSLPSPNLVWGTLGIFPKSVYVGRVLAREGVGHLHGHFATHPAMAAYIASEFGGLPYSFTAHAHDIFLSRSRPMLKAKIGKASFVRVISEYNRRFLEERYPKEAAGRIRVIHMGIDPSGYRRGEQEPGRIICVASLQPYKGIPALVEACARPPLRSRDFRLWVVGDGPQRAAVEKRILQLGIQDRVRLLGPRTQDEVAALLASSSIFVHPSTVTRRGWMDGIPVALMEAMATGLPVVSTWVSGIPELVEDGRGGILVFPDDPTALSEALASLLDDPHRARAMGAHGREKVKTAFHLEKCAGSLIGTLDLHTLPVPRELAEALAPGMKVVMDASTDAETGIVGLRRLHAGRDSLVAELATRTRNGTGELVVKVHREVDQAPRSAAERARLEFELLRRLHTSTNGSAGPPAVPRPLGIVADEGTLVMERASGIPLDARIRSWREGGEPDDTALLPILRATGRWLRAFQLRTAEDDEQARQALVDLLHTASGDLERSRPRLPRGLQAAIRSRILSCGTEGLSGPLRAVGHHCDFWPGNVFVDGNRITVIDFEGYRPGLPQEDVAYFLVHLELALSRPWHRHTRHRARRAFLEGYGVAEPGPDLDLCLMAKALQLLARASGGTGSRTASARWWKRKVLRGILERSVSVPPHRAPEAAGP